MGARDDGEWGVYMLRCGDGTHYVGATNDVVARFAAHETGRGARYTRGRAPLVVVFFEPLPDRSAALRREHALKRLSSKTKRALAAFHVDDG